MVKVLDLMEVHQVSMICKNLYREWRSVEIMSPGFESLDNCKEFMIIDAVVTFC